MSPSKKWPVVDETRQEHPEFHRMYSYNDDGWLSKFGTEGLNYGLAFQVPLMIVKLKQNGIFVDNIKILHVNHHIYQQKPLIQLSGPQIVTREWIYPRTIITDHVRFGHVPTEADYDSWHPVDIAHYKRGMKHIIKNFIEDDQFIISGDLSSFHALKNGNHKLYHVVANRSGMIGLVPNSDPLNKPKSQMKSMLRKLNEDDAQSIDKIRMNREARVQQYAPKIYFDICAGNTTNKYSKQELIEFATAIGIDTMSFVKQNGKDTLVNKDAICKIVKDVLNDKPNLNGLLRMSKSITRSLDDSDTYLEMIEDEKLRQQAYDAQQGQNEQ